MEKVVIVGAGVAGLGCMNALLDKGETPLLIEAGHIGTPKLCGEFLAPPAVPILTAWGVEGLRPISRVVFHQDSWALNVPFSRIGAAVKRSSVENALATRARSLGGRIHENTPIQSIIPAVDDSPFVMTLSTGKTIVAEHVIFATGKFAGIAPVSRGNAPAVGIKTYFPGVFSSEQLDMFPVLGGYIGLIAVSDTMSNLTALIRRDQLEKAGGGVAYLEQFLRTQPFLKGVSLDWSVGLQDLFEGLAPSFGQKRVPDWPRAWWIGDALASMHPAIGYGFAHALTSALSAADSFIKRDLNQYRERSIQHARRHLRISRLLHHGFQHPLAYRVCSSIPGVTRGMSRYFIHQLDY